MEFAHDKSVKTFVNELFVSDEHIEHKYRNMLAFFHKQHPSDLWTELQKVDPTEDVHVLVNWARLVDSNALKDAKAIAFHLTYPVEHVYGMEFYYYLTESFDAPIQLENSGEISLAGLIECGNIIGISKYDSPTRDIELADSYVPLIYAALVLIEALTSNIAFIVSQASIVYIVNFCAEAIPIGRVKEGGFCRAHKFL